MSTFTATDVPASRRSIGLRIFFWLIFVLILLIVGVVAYAYIIARAALPELDGNLSVRGLSAPVKVTRDGHGVPSIEAASLEDLFLAQGYVTAQDRLWQVDVMRRFGAGELSEILGEDTLKIDREHRILGLRAAAKKSLGTASPRDRSYFDAYARGVNAFIEDHRKSLPIEFHILKYQPKPWQAEDSISKIRATPAKKMTRIRIRIRMMTISMTIPDRTMR
jgi:penicillin amidase